MKTYKTGLYPLFDEKYVEFKNQSEILSNFNQVISAHTILWDRKNMESVLRELRGNEEGKFFNDGVLIDAKIPRYKLELKELEEDWQEYKEEKMNQGYPEPTDMPANMLHGKLIFEAKLCILEEEANKLEERIKQTYLDPIEVKSEDEVLKWGLQCNGSLTDGILSEMDGQLVEKNEEGILIIVDKRSPYQGMSIPDYRKLSEQWKADEKIRDQKEYESIKQSARDRGLPIPGGYSSYGRRVFQNELPSWPDGVVNHLQETQNSSIGI